MALLIKKNKTRMLSPYEGQSSRILKIEKVDRNKRSFSASSGKRTENKSPPDDVYLYEVFFKIDMKKALRAKVENVEFKVLKSQPRKKAGNFIPISSNTPSQLVASLYYGESQSIDDLKNDTRSKTLGEGNISLYSEINSLNIKLGDSLENKTDKEIFGEIKRFKLINPSKTPEGQKISKKLAIIDKRKNIDDETSRVFSSYSFNDCYMKIISEGEDPAVAFFSYDSLESSISGRGGSELENYTSKYSKKISKNDIDKIRSKFESSVSSTSLELSDFSNNQNTVVAIETIEPNRVRVIRHVFKITSSSLKKMSTFKIDFKIKDPKSGLTTENLSIEIPHQINIENYYIPEYLPEISISKSRLNKATYTINANISNIDPERISDLKIYQRRITDDSHIYNSEYSNIETDGLMNNFMKKALINQPCYRISNISKINTSQMTTLRVSPITVAGMRIGNISSSSVFGDNFNYVLSGISATSNGGGVFLQYFINSSRASGACVYKKRNGESRYYPLNILKPENMIDKTLGGQLIDFEKRDSQSSTSMIGRRVDKFSFPDDVNNYRLKIFLKNGGSTWSKSIAYAKDVRQIPGILTSLFASPAQINIEGGEITSVSFEINYISSVTSADQILSVLRADGNESIFEDVITDTRTNLSDIIVFSISRQNLKTSQTDFLGIVKDLKFIDSSEASEKLERNTTYRYVISSYLANPDQIKSYFNAFVDYNKSVINDIYQIKIPSFIEKIKKTVSSLTPSQLGISDGVVSSESIEAFNNLKIEKYYNGKSLSSGVIDSSTSFEHEYNLLKYPTGHTYNFELTTPKDNFVIDANRNSITRSNSGAPVVRFSISPDNISKISNIDYIIITCKRNENFVIAGACSCDLSGEVSFIDYGSRNFVGQISYYASIVTNEGILVNENNLISSGVLIESTPSSITISGKNIVRDK